MLCQITFESIIKLREYELLLISDTSVYECRILFLSDSFYFIILCYIEQKIYLFVWRPAISRFKCPKKFRSAGDYGLLKVSTLKVKRQNFWFLIDMIFFSSSSALQPWVDLGLLLYSFEQAKFSSR